jgi:hypothetical protein
MNRYLLTLLSCITFSLGYSQFPAKKWDSLITSASGKVYLEDVAITNDGNYVAAGYDLTNPTKAFVVKMSADGEELWRKVYDGNYRSQFFSITILKDGKIVAAGQTYSNGSNDNDFYIVKLNPSNGDIIWEETFGGTGEDYAYSVNAVSDGGLIVGGTTNSTNGDITTTYGNFDAWILKLNTNGELLWSKSLGGENNDEVKKIQETSDNGFILTGQKSPCCHYYADKSFNTDIYVAKLSSTGAVEWEKLISGNNYEMGKDIIETSDGGYLLGADVRSYDGDFEYNAGIYDAYIIKLDAEGDIEWKKYRATSDGDYVTGVAEVSDGYFMLSHTIDSYNPNTNSVVSKYTLEGNFVQSITVSDSLYSPSAALKAIPTGSFIYVGRSGNIYKAYGYIAKYGDDNPAVITSTLSKATINEALRVYPNPATSNLNVPLTTPSSIRVVNIMGETVFTVNGESGTNIIQTSSLTPGIYQIITDNGPAQKVVIGQ